MNTSPPHMENTEFARRVRLLMSKNGKTLAQIAEQTGNAVSTVSTWRRGRIPKSPRAKEMLAEALGATTDELYTFHSGEIFANEKPSPRMAESGDTSANEASVANTRRRIRLYFRDFLESVDTQEELEKIFTDLRVFFPLSPSAKRQSAGARR